MIINHFLDTSLTTGRIAILNEMFKIKDNSLINNDDENLKKKKNKNEIS